MAKPIMARATAVWLVDNTTLSFKQIADFVEMHELEVQGIADGDVAQGVKGFDPIANNQLTEEEIEKGQANPLHKLKLKFNASAQGEEKRRGPRYTPLSKRQDRPVDLLAGQVPPRTLRRSGQQAGRHHQANHSGDPRADALEHCEHPTDRSRGFGSVQTVRTGRRRPESRCQESRRRWLDDR